MIGLKFLKDFITTFCLEKGDHRETRCRVATRVRGEGRDHGGLGLRRRGEGIGCGREALLKKKKNEQEEEGDKMINKMY